MACFYLSGFDFLVASNSFGKVLVEWQEWLQCLCAGTSRESCCTSRAGNQVVKQFEASMR